MERFFRFDGRIRRQTYWLIGIGVSIVGSALAGILMAIGGDDPNILISLLLIVIYLAVAVIGLSFAVRRWHDLNKSGWWVLINLVPILGSIYTLIMLGFMPGDQGSNDYGPAPEEGVLLP